MSLALPSVWSPTSAYRADSLGREGPFGLEDELWLAAAAQLHLAATTKNQVAQRQYLFEALSITLDCLGDEAIDAFVAREWFGRHSMAEALVVLADRIIEAGAYRLAAVMLDDLVLPAARLSTLERGRILALRARTAWRLGQFDEARERFEYVRELGAEAGEKELELRAAVGLSTVAQLRGNIPALAEQGQRAATLAREIGHRFLERWAYFALTIAAAKRGNHAEALAAGWKAIELSEHDADLEVEALQNLGQATLEAGSEYAEIARSCFAAVMARPTGTVLLLSALGGLVRASAMIGDEATVEWGMREAWRARNEPLPQTLLGELLFECALALQMLGRAGDMERYRRAAHEIAEANGFHELAFKSARLEPTTPRVRERVGAYLPASAEVVAKNLERMEPEQLPERLTFKPASV
jgi:tetratricopeptide (TPR) repeat protein